jgi:hypothetical protein
MEDTDNAGASVLVRTSKTWRHREMFDVRTEYGRRLCPRIRGAKSMTGLSRRTSGLVHQGPVKSLVPVQT